MAFTNEKCKELLTRVTSWCASQKNVRLVLGKPLSEKEINHIPFMMVQRNIPDHYFPERFRIPDSYRCFLRLARFARIEFREDKSNWLVFNAFDIYSPATVALARAWVPRDTTIDEGEVSTTEFIAFADGGCNG